MTEAQTNLRLRIEKLVYGGDGLARHETGVYLAPYVLPGEIAVAAETQRRGGVWRAENASVEEPSPERVPPRCQYFEHCGGCHYQHAAYGYQLQQKVEILREVLRRIAKIDDAGEIPTVSGDPWEYRNRIQLHVAKRRIGFLEARSRKLVDVAACPIASPRLNQALGTLRRLAGDRRWPDFLDSFELFTNEREIQINVLDVRRPVAKRFFDWLSEEIPGLVPGPLTYEVARFRYRVSGKSFFQVNRHLTGDLVRLVTGDVEGGRALDLYAGVGLFSLPLARGFRSVTAVESVRSASDDLRANADAAGIELRTPRASVEEFLEAERESYDFVLADPPRSGLGKRTVAELIRIRPKRLTLVACDPATLARDLAELLGAGYRMDGITLIDLFPQTYHIETVVRLTAS